VVSAMIEGGADINKAKNNGCTPLHTASENGHVEVVRALVEGGADIDKADENG
jgi:ankyrin repeat protein